jgi:transcriptional regulator with XRE-family HTH domain
MLADLLRRRRGELGLSLREAARRIGISPAYLSSLEHGRNPSTGRPPVPSPPVLGEIGRVLGIDLETLLGLAGAGVPPRSAHVLLVQLGTGGRPAVDGAQAVAPGVDAWVELAEPLGVGPGRRDYDPALALQALRMQLRGRRADGGAFGLIVGATARPLGRVADPGPLLAAEETWEDDVARACLEPMGRAPAANVCVYREADIRALEADEPLAVALALVRAHPLVAAQREDGEVLAGAAAIEELLRRLHPEAVASATWAQLAAAAARGLGRRAPAP